MRAAVLNGNHVALQEVPKPTLVEPTDVLLKVTATMICTSDVHYAEGFMPPSPPFVLGHEFAGVVEEVGDSVTTLEVGDRVVVPAYPFCNNCEMCRRGVTGLCPNGACFGSGQDWGNLPGGLADYVRAPLADSALLKIPDHVSDEQASFLSDTLATAYMAVRNAEIKPGQTVVVVGAGPIGLCAVSLARLFSPSRIIVVGRRANRLDTALKMGATDIIDTAAVDEVDAVLQLTGGEGGHAVLDTVGTPESIGTAVQLLRAAGHLSLVGFPPPGDFAFPLQALMIKNSTMRIAISDQDNMPFLMDQLQRGNIDVSPLITHVLPLDDFDQAFTMFAEKGDNCMKVVLKP